MYTTRDYWLVLLVGFLVGWLVLLPLTATKLVALTPLSVAASVIGFSLVAPLALAVLGVLSRQLPVLGQFGKFAAVGTLNTLLNIAVLNGFILWTEVTEGYGYSGFVAMAFVVATTNSYFWNKFWTFESRKPVTGGEYLRFLGFTVVGALLNIGAASLVVNVIGAPEGFDKTWWANIGALAGVAVSFLWNFTAYRRIVFRNSDA